MELLGNALPWILIVVSVALIGLILLQRSGAELGGAFGGGDGSGGTLYTRRGFEQVLFIVTIVLAVVFVVANFGALLMLAR
ncbi:MAG: preprotein translocase subunit SecG [Candidatus Lloydbacteria bacterium RIFCSPLOWO2_01_FULL_50_20]|uniref:Protein-export membrane protein SecG n=1 Tax=Candidatus Lloydbacteria bacterium RIFCSPLOWO2_01_FULL_50_20 TaxID=1798665 RepID=A0A1G2DC69_9BACT|nr:MAG: preprotein translocase subunit SecG [Candidatus Lloydbacteria bacterium RIFCSPHIGHO2_02_FULL_50_11]OGZ11133.1 MAG: preprotein translocase subunit SecG [Candidatus Lloydbacteria bacterium RIFCSPLOWO2_01_FULL_50_20]